MLRLIAVAAVTVLATAACGTSDGTASGPTATTPSASETTSATTAPPSLDSLVIAPGAVGAAKAGMTKADALATGLFDADVVVGGDECERTEPLQWKSSFGSAVDVLTTDDGTIASLGVSGPGPKTADGLGIGSTLADVSGVYETAEMLEAGYGQTGVFVNDGTDAWLGFLFDATTDDIEQTSPITFIEVTQGSRPDLMRDGC